MKISKLMMAGALACSAGIVSAQEVIGSVDTVFKWTGPDHKIIMEVFDDPLVKGVSCYMSRAKTGGFKGMIGVAEDKSDASVECVQVGPISFNGKIPKQGEVFTQSTSILFKKIRVVRAVDIKRQTLVYMVYSDKLIEGSPKNSITAVPVGKPIPLK